MAASLLTPVCMGY
jgi:hypothetical protein